VLVANVTHRFFAFFSNYILNTDLMALGEKLVETQDEVSVSFENCLHSLNHSFGVDPDFKNEI